MIGWLKARVPEQNRRFLARIVLWGGLFGCVAGWSVMMRHLHRFENADQEFRAYFKARDALGSLQASTGDSLQHTASDRAVDGTFDGWRAAARMLENAQRYGEERGIAVTYQIDSLQMVENGNPSIKSMPVRFRVKPGNRFDAVLDFMKVLCTDTTVAVRLERAELISDDKGLADVYITIITWMRL